MTELKQVPRTAGLPYQNPFHTKLLPHSLRGKKRLAGEGREIDVLYFLLPIMSQTEGGHLNYYTLTPSFLYILILFLFILYSLYKPSYDLRSFLTEDCTRRQETCWAFLTGTPFPKDVTIGMGHACC